MDTSITKRPSWRKYDELIRDSAEEYGIPWEWVKAILLQESTLGENERVQKGEVSSDGKSYGVAQLTPQTASWLARVTITPEDLNDPETSIDLCARYLRFLKDKFLGDEQKTIMSYNQGQGNTEKGKLDMRYYLSWADWLELVKQNP